MLMCVSVMPCHAREKKRGEAIDLSNAGVPYLALLCLAFTGFPFFLFFLSFPFLFLSIHFLKCFWEANLPIRLSVLYVVLSIYNNE